MNEILKLKADLARVKAERDQAILDICELREAILPLLLAAAPPHLLAKHGITKEDAA